MAAITSLTPEQIELITGSVRERGGYKRFMAQFIESGAQGVNASEHFPGKKPATLYQGFNSVKKDQNLENIRVLNHEDQVYLIVTSQNGTEPTESDES
jgi:hypothetical protein